MTPGYKLAAQSLQAAQKDQRVQAFPCFLIGELRDHGVFSGSEAAASTQLFGWGGGAVILEISKIFTCSLRGVFFDETYGERERNI